MTEHIQWGGELQGMDLSDVHHIVASDLPFGQKRASQELEYQIRLIGQFWTEVAELYKEADRRQEGLTSDDPNYYQGVIAGRASAFYDILELSKKYPFG